MTAGDRLDAIFAARSDEGATGPKVGVFGNGFPEILLAAVGALPLHIEAAPESIPHTHSNAVAAVVERFVDGHVHVFLHRLVAGHFDHLPAIVFPRDDAAALVAYQYAREFGRTGAISVRPRLILWNLVYAPSPAAQDFNQRQLQRTWSELSEALACEVEPGRSLEAFAAERRRDVALRRLLAQRDSGAVSGVAAYRWRNAGRYMTAEEHATLLEQAIESPSAPAAPRGPAAPRIGLVGSMLATEAVHERLDSIGRLVADLQPQGDVWPGPGAGADTVDACLEREAADPACLRTVPPEVHVRWLLERVLAARCDVVVAQLAPTDDTFGWEIPRLRRELERHGVPLVDAGFRDEAPVPAWLDALAARLTSILGVTA